jgi:hypothetical protein
MTYSDPFDLRDEVYDPELHGTLCAPATNRWLAIALTIAVAAVIAWLLS